MNRLRDQRKVRRMQVGWLILGFYFTSKNLLVKLHLLVKTAFTSKKDLVWEWVPSIIKLVFEHNDSTENCHFLSLNSIKCPFSVQNRSFLIDCHFFAKMDEKKHNFGHKCFTSKSIFYYFLLVNRFYMKIRADSYNWETSHFHNVSC